MEQGNDSDFRKTKAPVRGRFLFERPGTPARPQDSPKSADNRSRITSWGVNAFVSVRTREVKSRVAEALRLAAQSLHRAQNYFGGLYRRWPARLGSPKAITAMAHT